MVIWNFFPFIMDFTLTTYKNLLVSLAGAGFTFQTFQDFLKAPASRAVILRHDVDERPQNALMMARVEHGMGVQASYYFRILKISNNPAVIAEIARMGHEIGYHYENMDLVSRGGKDQRSEVGSRRSMDGSQRSEVRGRRPEDGNRRSEVGGRASEGGRRKAVDTNFDPRTRRIRLRNGAPRKDNEEDLDELIDFAYADFCRHLANFRKRYDVRTICMHGSPMSRYDNRMIWQKYDYRQLGIIGEPYFDIDFDKVFYLTDTGRRWDGWQSSIRDKLPQQADWIRQGLVFHTTADIIRAAQDGRLPAQIMFTVHPQRWHDRPFPWLRELVLQNAKNIIKKNFYRR